MIYEIVQMIHNEEGIAYAFQAWDEPSLRDGVRTLFETRTSAVNGIDAKSASYHPQRCVGGSLHLGRLCVFVDNGMEFETGEYETRSLHLSGITASSARRLCKLLDCPVY